MSQLLSRTRVQRTFPDDGNLPLYSIMNNHGFIFAATNNRGLNYSEMPRFAVLFVGEAATPQQAAYYKIPGGSIVGGERKVVLEMPRYPSVTLQESSQGSEQNLQC